MEYAHAMGNDQGGLTEYQHVFYRTIIFRAIILGVVRSRNPGAG
ncbi:hypothetical protein ACLK19_20535 [Escherichia coli]